MPLLLKALAAIKPAAIGAICVDLAALVAWFVIVRDDWVRDAGDQFARALLARCDTLDVSPAARPSSAASARRTRPASTANAESLRTRSGGGDPYFGRENENASSIYNPWITGQQHRLGAHVRHEFRRT